MNVLVGVISQAEAWVMPRSFVERLRRDFPQHTFVDVWDFEGIRRGLPDADVAFVPHVSPRMLAEARRLKWIQSPAVGVSNMLFPEMVARDVVITCARGIRARAIAEHVIGVMIALARQFHLAIRRQVERVWSQNEIEGRTTLVFALDGRRMGIIGLGAIGCEVAVLAHAFGLDVTGVRRRVDRPVPPGVDRVLPAERLDLLLAESDVVVLAAPETSSTGKLIGARELGLMKPGSLFINVSRGSLVDDAALAAALESGRLGGAALDVFTSEPLDPGSRYWDLPNVIITPHTSGAMGDYWDRLVDLFSDNLRRFERGEPLLHVVDKHAGY